MSETKDEIDLRQVIDKDRARAVAQDMLDTIDRRNYRRGVYLEGRVIVSTPDVPTDVQQIVSDVEERCQVCALGSAFLSKAKLYDSCPVADHEVNQAIGQVFLRSSFEYLALHLEPIFGLYHMILLEAFFEAQLVHDVEDLEEYGFDADMIEEAYGAAVAGAELAGNVSRVTEALDNFIRNDGRLVVEPVGVDEYDNRFGVSDDDDDDDFEDDEDDDFEDDDFEDDDFEDDEDDEGE